jgi:outer membrane protein with glycine zipper
MKTVHALALVAGLAMTGCAGERNREVAASDSLSRDLELAPSDTVAPEPLPEAAAPVPTDTVGSRTQRAQVGARTRAAAEPRATTRPTESRARRQTRARTTAREPVATGAYAPGAGGADTAAPKARPDPARDSVAAVASAESTAVSAPPAPAATSRTDTVAPGVATEPVESAATAPSPAPSGAPTSAANTLPVGTEFRAQLRDTINSLRNSEGQTVIALVSGDVRAPDGLTVLPSGSTVHVYIVRLRPARTRSASDGELQLRVDSITVPGHSYTVRADVGPVPHELRGRGVTAGEVEKVGAGAAAGAVVGGVVTGKKKGAVIGGVIGAAGGAVVAAHTASRDVVVTPGTLLTLVLRQPVTRVAR